MMNALGFESGSNYPFHLHVGNVLATAERLNMSTGNKFPHGMDEEITFLLRFSPLGNPNGILRMPQVRCMHNNHLKPKMNSPELIATLALGNVISKQLADKMLDTVKDAPHVTDNDVKPALLVEVDIVD